MPIIFPRFHFSIETSLSERPIIGYEVKFARAISVAILLLLCVYSCIAKASEEIRFTRPDGESLSAAQIDETVVRLMQAGNVPGLALALISENKVAYLKTYGMADVAETRPLQTDTIMYGASLTKAAFAYMVMTLVQDGVLDLDRSISEYLPKPLDQYEDYTDLASDERWRVWTLRMLLSHQAGLPNWRWFSESQKLELLFEPGSRYAYSGEGIQIAQLTLEEGLGLDVNELMQKRVFDRFGMFRTSMLWREDFRPNFARGYDKTGKNLGHNVRQSVRAAGSMDRGFRAKGRSRIHDESVRQGRLGAMWSRSRVSNFFGRA
jgi:CubicO group peptidase (beta-lactamase class C family)